jgi:hypothetical protein
VDEHHAQAARLLRQFRTQAHTAASSRPVVPRSVPPAPGWGSLTPRSTLVGQDRVKLDMNFLTLTREPFSFGLSGGEAWSKTA